MFFSNKKNCPFPDSSLTVNIYSFVDTERNTVPTTNPKPISSITVNLVPSSKAERSVADAGSRQPSNVDFTGPIYFTLSRNTENPTAVPIITMPAMMIHASSKDCEHISFDIILFIFFHSVLPVPAFLSEVLLRTDFLLISTSSSCRVWMAGSFVRSCQGQGNPALE